jgi:hypothetical protein
MVAVLWASAAAVGADDTPAKGLAAECVACARSCPQKCVPKGGKCICTANELADCRNACDATAGSDAAALERCRSQCSNKRPSH